MCRLRSRSGRTRSAPTSLRRFRIAQADSNADHALVRRLVVPPERRPWGLRVGKTVRFISSSESFFPSANSRRARAMISKNPGCALSTSDSPRRILPACLMLATSFSKSCRLTGVPCQQVGKTSRSFGRDPECPRRGRTGRPTAWRSVLCYAANLATLTGRSAARCLRCILMRSIS